MTILRNFERPLWGGGALGQRALPGRRSERAFTMVEIAFSLAIVAFALVAIMGVLPAGMNVQKDNRDDTIINHDGAFWLETLKSGSKGIEDLVNYVESISVTNADGGFVRTNFAASAEIVALLTMPKTTNTGTKILTNTVLARVRAINGNAAEKTDPKNDFAFRYELQPEITPANPTPNVPGVSGLNLAANLQELRLTLRWPIFEQGNSWAVGRNRRTVRGLVNGSYRPAVWTDQTGGRHTNYFIEPNIYAYVQDPTVAP